MLLHILTPNPNPNINPNLNPNPNPNPDVNPNSHPFFLTIDFGPYPSSPVLRLPCGCPQLLAGQKPLPLTDIPEARRKLRLNEDQILQLIETGDLFWAWHLGIHPSPRRIIRIFAPCIDAYHAGLDTVTRDQDQIFNAILPPEDEIPLPELAVILNCSHTHLLRLYRENQLYTQPRRIQRGPNGCPKITRASIEQFLIHRRCL